MKLLTKVFAGAAVLCTGAALIYADVKPVNGFDLGRVTSTRSQIERDQNDVAVLRAKAHRDKDLIKLNCVNDKVLLIKGELNIAEAIYTQVVSGNGGSPDAYQSKGNDIHRLAEAAKQCVDSVRLSSEGRNSFSTSTLIPTVTDSGNPPYLENPGYASPDD